MKLTTTKTKVFNISRYRDNARIVEVISVDYGVLSVKCFDVDARCVSRKETRLLM